MVVMSPAIFNTKRCALLTNQHVNSRMRPGRVAVAIAAAIPYSEVQAKETCNKDHNHHDTDNVKNVHWVLRSN